FRRKRGGFPPPVRRVFRCGGFVIGRKQMRPDYPPPPPPLPPFAKPIEERTMPIRLKQTPTTYRDAVAILPAAAMRHKRMWVSLGAAAKKQNAPPRMIGRGVLLI